MKLVRLSQDLDVTNPENISYFLVFLHEDGEEERIPVPETTAHSLLAKVMKKQAVKSTSPDLEKMAEPEVPEGASVFGDDDGEYHPKEEDEEEFTGSEGNPPTDDGRFEVERSL